MRSPRAPTLVASFMVLTIKHPWQTNSYRCIGMTEYSNVVRIVVVSFIVAPSVGCIYYTGPLCSIMSIISVPIGKLVELSVCRRVSVCVVCGEASKLLVSNFTLHRVTYTYYYICIII